MGVCVCSSVGNLELFGLQGRHTTLMGVEFGMAE